MRPPNSQFGNDITNATNNGNNNNTNDRPGGDGRGNDNDENGNPIISNIVQMGGIRMIPVITGQGIVRVVGRCEDAKENSKLGEFMNSKISI